MLKFILSIHVILILTLLACKNEQKKHDLPTVTKTGNQITASDLPTDQNGLSHATALIKTVHGNIIFKFYPKKAPNTVTRMIELIQQGFYDGLTFHRVIENFIIQGGDPTGLGTGGSGHKLKAEFSSIQHIRGTVAMARDSNNEDSADSQFYITLGRLKHLDGKNTVLGQVVEGLEILNRISKNDKMLSVSIKF